MREPRPGPPGAAPSVVAFAEPQREALRRLFLASRRASFTWLDPAAFRLEDFDAATAGERIWVAERGAAPVGFVSAWLADDFLHNLFVHPAHVGAGAGSSLLRACVAALGRPARLKCLRLNARALGFYLRRGWAIEGEGRGPDGEYWLLRLG